MINIYLNSSYWEKLTFSKLRFSKFKKAISGSGFWWAPTQAYNSDEILFMFGFRDIHVKGRY